MDKTVITLETLRRGYSLLKQRRDAVEEEQERESKVVYRAAPGEQLMVLEGGRVLISHPEKVPRIFDPSTGEEREVRPA
jgi:hypothetical protein